MSVVVITGGTSGIGFGLAEDFLKKGHRVAIAGRDEARLSDALGRLAAGEKVSGAACDMAKRSDVDALRDHAVKTFGGLDIWINCAGLAHNTRMIVDLGQDQIEAMIATNMLGQINGSRAAAEHMVRNGGGKIFNVLGGGSNGEYFPGMGVYGATKRGLDYFTDALAKELAAKNVIVGKIRPGMVVTEAVLREARANPDMFQRSRKTMNILVDQVETVAPWLADQIVRARKPGTKIAWLTGGKIGRRMLAARFVTRPDQFARFGL